MKLLPRSSTRNTSKTFYAQYESSFSKSNTNRTEPLVLSDTVINVENGEFSRFIARFVKKRKRNKRGEFTGRDGRATQVGKTHVTSRPSEVGCRSSFGFTANIEGSEPRRANRASQPETANNRDIACLVAPRAHPMAPALHRLNGSRKHCDFAAMASAMAAYCDSRRANSIFSRLWCVG